MTIAYSDLVLESRGCAPGSLDFLAKFKFNTDVSSLFPFINAVAEKPSYFDNPHYIKFAFDKFKCAMYPDNGILSIVENQDQAIAAIEKLMEFLNDIHSRTDSIQPNHRKFRIVPALNIYKLLPKTNCKACGFQTCMSFAGALGKGETTLDICPGLCNDADENVTNLKSMLFE